MPADGASADNQFQALLDACADAVVITDHHGLIQSFNRSAEQLFGYPSTEIIGQPVELLMPEPDRSQHAGYMQRYLATLEPHVIGIGRDVLALRRDGTAVPVSLAIGRIPGSHEPRFVAFLHDLTERRERESKLRRSEALLREAQRLAQLGNFEYHLPPRQNDYWSAELLRILGLDYAQGGFTVQRLLEQVHPDDRPRARTDLEHPGGELGSGEFSADYRIVRADGQLRHAQLRWRVLRTDNGLTRVAGTLHDVTERHEAADTVRETQQRLTHVARLSTLGEMTTGLAHELNQPLTAIALYAQAAERLLAADPAELGDVREALQQISAQALRAGEVIRRLRSLVKKRETRDEPLSVNDLVRELAVLTQTDARLNDVRVELHLAEELPRVLADPIQLQQVLINLVRNAIDALQSRPVGTRQVEVRTGRNGSGAIEVAVLDNGSGVPTAVVGKLFDAFFTTKAEGTGLGLAISRSIIASHGGQLHYRPNLPRGSCFYFTLPALKGDVA